MAALEVSDSWSSWKMSHEMDQLECTWRASVLALKPEPAQPPLLSDGDGVQRSWSQQGLALLPAPRLETR